MIEIWRYALHFRTAANRASGRRRIEGFLLREDGGHGCVQPWPEFGQPKVDEQLAALAAGRRTELLDSALRCAAVDRAWRQAGRSLFDGLEVPPSHATITDPDRQAADAWRAGFQTFKLKCGTSAGDAACLRDLADAFPGLLLRLDFNEMPTPESFERWWCGLDDPLRQRVDFIEDPFPFDGGAWSGFSRRHGVRLAADRRSSLARAGEAAVRVVKPAWADSEALPQGDRPQEIVFTSAMDHPLGQAWAAWVAGQAMLSMSGRVRECGLQTHHLFDPDAFTERLGGWQSEFHPPGGTGLGFDDLLDRLEWETP